MLPLRPGKLWNSGKVGTPSLLFSREPRPQGLHLSGQVQVSERIAPKPPKKIEI